MSLTQSLIMGGEQPTVYDAVEPPASCHIAVGSFHQHSGPVLFDCTLETVDRSRLGLLLFPAKWADNTQFAFEENGLFGLVFCTVAQRIINDRGPLQVSIAVLSSSPTFVRPHLDFLTEAARLTATLPSLDFGPFVELARQRSLFEAIPIDEPLCPFFSRRVVSTALLANPTFFLCLWRARVLGLCLSVTSTQVLSDATALAAFLGAFGGPITPLRECIYHVDLHDLPKYQARTWRVCCVTHPMMQNQAIADLSLGPERLVGRPSLPECVMKGRGNIISQLVEIARSGNDRQLLDRFMQLNQQLVNLAAANREMTRQDLHRIGLDKANAKFLGQFFRNRGSRTSVDQISSIC
jgi:hypothetical protein